MHTETFTVCGETITRTTLFDLYFDGDPEKHCASVYVDVEDGDGIITVDAFQMSRDLNSFELNANDARQLIAALQAGITIIESGR